MKSILSLLTVVAFGLASATAYPPPPGFCEAHVAEVVKGGTTYAGTQSGSTWTFPTAAQGGVLWVGYSWAPDLSGGYDNDPIANGFITGGPVNFDFQVTDNNTTVMSFPAQAAATYSLYVGITQKVTGVNARVTTESDYVTVKFQD